ncbi:MAG: hypothetical protein R3F30_14545 [Planctomycetota bacterium]
MTRLAKGVVMFRADDKVTGQEPWISFGTPKTTMLLKDIDVWTYGTKTGGDEVQYIVAMQDKVLFWANDGSNGIELWSSDGTAAGTSLVKDIYPGSSSSYPSHKVLLGDKVIFAVDSPGLGKEPWVTDGTAAGTLLLKDLQPGSGSSSPIWLTRIGDKVYFQATTSSTGYELFETDGTPGGTRLLKDIGANGGASYPSHFIEFKGQAYFSAYNPAAGVELHVSDGTATGTRLLKDIDKGTRSSEPKDFAVLGDQLFFVASDLYVGMEVWVSDGTEAGTRVFKDINSGLASSYPHGLVAQGGMLWFFATDGTNGVQLWQSDGTSANTRMVKLSSHDLVPRYMTPVGTRRIYLSGMTAASGRELCTIDTTRAPLAVHDFDLDPIGGSEPYNGDLGSDRFAVMDGYLWCAASRTPKGEKQLWRVSNGGTAQVVGYPPPFRPFQGRPPTTTLSVTDPLIGKPVTIEVATGVSTPFQLLLLGRPVGRPVPSLGNYLYFDVLAPSAVFATVGGPRATFVVPIPNDNALVDARMVLQTIAVDVLAFPAGTELSNGVHLVIGNTW